MTELAAIAQTVAIISACWAIFSGIGAWKREFIGKRRIEIAEQALAKFFEVRDAIAFIRNPFSSTEEGKSRKRAEGESPEESQILDRGYVVVERYTKKENVFAEFNTLKYRFMAVFGRETEEVFTGTTKILNSIFVAARMLVSFYWRGSGRDHMRFEEFSERLRNEMEAHEEIFWDKGAVPDKIQNQLQEINDKLEKVTASSFQKPLTKSERLTRAIRRVVNHFIEP